MSFPIILGTSAADPRRLEKTLNNPKTYTGTLRADTDIVNPTVVIADSLANVRACNYARIESFGRYYYITDYVQLENGLVAVSMHVDVLMTYASAIRSGTGIVARSAVPSLANERIADMSHVVQVDHTTDLIAYPEGFTSQALVLNVAGPPKRS